jgi:MFS family permease
MGKNEKIKQGVKIALGSVLVIFFWWATITGYSIGDPIDPIIVAWGIVFVFGAILGPVLGILAWPFLLREVFVNLRKRKSSK